MSDEIEKLVEGIPDVIEEGGWEKKSLRPLKEAILLLDRKIEGIVVPPQGTETEDRRSATATSKKKTGED